jgi:hypothetical protein
MLYAMLDVLWLLLTVVQAVARLGQELVLEKCGGRPARPTTFPVFRRDAICSHPANA